VDADVRIELLRAPDDADLRGREDLIERTARHDGHRPIGEHALVELQSGPREFPHLAVVARAGDDLVGYAHLSKRETPLGWRFEAFVAPAWRRRGIGTRLVDTVLETVGADGGGRVHFWAYDPGSAHARIVARHGMRLARWIVRLQRPLPGPEVPLPDGFALRAFAPEDADEWLIVHNEAFAGHPDGGGWRPQDLAWHLEEPWFDPTGLILATDDVGIAGYCWMKPEGSVASLYFLGVHPRARGHGLGKALTAAGLRWATQEGAHLCQLYADAGDAAALGVYRSVGFTEDHRDECYALDVAPA
jgi:mycothiol synthase